MGRNYRWNHLHHTGILPASINADLANLSDNIHAVEDSVSEDLCKALESLHLSKSMKIETILSIPEEDVVYEIIDEGHIITEIVDMFKEEDSNNLEEADDSTSN